MVSVDDPLDYPRVDYSTLLSNELKCSSLILYVYLSNNFHITFVFYYFRLLVITSFCLGYFYRQGLKPTPRSYFMFTKMFEQELRQI